MNKCKNCNKEIPRITFPSGRLESISQWKRKKYCSHKCSCDIRKTKNVKICKFCGNEYTIKYSPQSNRYIISKYCSLSCRGKHRSELVRLGKYTYRHSEETKRKITNSNKGQKRSKETVKKMSITTTELMKNPQTREKISKTLKKRFEDPIERERNAKSLANYWAVDDNKEKQSYDRKKWWANLPEEEKQKRIRNVVKSLKMSPSKLEQKMINIIKEEKLPFKFVGNREFFIGTKIPDFINKEKKIAVEVFSIKHKEIIGQAKDIGIEQWKKERAKYFKDRGWDTYFFSTSEVNEPNVLKILSKYNN